MGFGQYTENTKDQIINLIRTEFQNQGWSQEEMPKMEKFNFYSEDPYETFVRVLTQLPDIDQQLPLIAVTIGTAEGAMMGIGSAGDYLGMVRDDDGYYWKRYSSAVTMTINIDVGTEDTNTRSELVDIVLGLFQFYMRDKRFEHNAPEDSEENWQMIFDRIVHVTGEEEVPKPEADPQDKVYINRIEFGVMYIDYVDRLAEGQGKVGHGVDEAHKGPISIVEDTQLRVGNLRWIREGEEDQFNRRWLT